MSWTGASRGAGGVRFTVILMFVVDVLGWGGGPQRWADRLWFAAIHPARLPSRTCCVQWLVVDQLTAVQWWMRPGTLHITARASIPGSLFLKGWTCSSISWISCCFLVSIFSASVFAVNRSEALFQPSAMVAKQRILSTANHFLKSAQLPLHLTWPCLNQRRRIRYGFCNFFSLSYG